MILLQFLPAHETIPRACCAHTSKHALFHVLLVDCCTTLTFDHPGTESNVLSHAWTVLPGA